MSEVVMWRCAYDRSHGMCGAFNDILDESCGACGEPRPETIVVRSAVSTPASEAPGVSDGEPTKPMTIEEIRGRRQVAETKREVQEDPGEPWAAMILDLCDSHEALRAQLAAVERERAKLEDEKSELSIRLLKVAKLAAPTPQFDGPMGVWEAERIRDDVLEAARAPHREGRTP
jgi:hypothetical protein